MVSICYILQTCGTELHVKKVSVPDTNDAVEIFIYDSSGQDIYSNYLPKYVSNHIYAIYLLNYQSFVPFIINH